MVNIAQEFSYKGCGKCMLFSFWNEISTERKTTAFSFCHDIQQTFVHSDEGTGLAAGVLYTWVYSPTLLSSPGQGVPRVYEGSSQNLQGSLKNAIFLLLSRKFSRIFFTDPITTLTGFLGVPVARFRESPQHISGRPHNVSPRVPWKYAAEFL